MHPVVHFELPYSDGNRIAGFYKNVFGWEILNLGEEGGNYILVTTAVTDAKPGFPAGTINGGLYPVKPDWPAQYPSIVTGVDNIHQIMKEINNSGGETLGEPVEISGFGMYVSFLDTEGNRNSIIQPDETML